MAEVKRISIGFSTAWRCLSCNNKWKRKINAKICCKDNLGGKK